VLLVVDYGMGNVSSIRNMLSRCGATDVVVSGDPLLLQAAQRIILPGVGAYDAAMRNIETRGLRVPLITAAKKGTPLLGICLGMQLLAEGSAEGTLPGLGLIKGFVRRFEPSRFDAPAKIPHMGWNYVDVTQSHRLFAGDSETPRFYFVHSYHFVCRDKEDVIGETNHGYRFTSAIARANVVGVQFHPEKSHSFGKRLLDNFAALE
jgi:glutamine amidotransferase